MDITSFPKPRLESSPAHGKPLDFNLGGVAKAEEERWVLRTRQAAIELASSVNERVLDLVAEAQGRGKSECVVFCQEATVEATMAAGLIEEYCRGQGLRVERDRGHVAGASETPAKVELTIIL